MQYFLLLVIVLPVLSDNILHRFILLDLSLRDPTSIYIYISVEEISLHLTLIISKACMYVDPYTLGSWAKVGPDDGVLSSTTGPDALPAAARIELRFPEASHRGPLGRVYREALMMYMHLYYIVLGCITRRGLRSYYTVIYKQ